MPSGDNFMIRLRSAAVWVCAIFLGMVFVYAGISKLGGPSASGWSERFARWGYPANASYVIGGLELLGGLGILSPRFRRPGASILAAVMAGALCTHAVYAEFPRLIPPLVLGGLAVLLYRATRLTPGAPTAF